MIPIDGQPILSAVEMRAAEDALICAGTSVQELMERAGAGAADAIRRLASGAPVLILCGPGNNGGDGYVAARILKENGADVRIAASHGPRTDAAIEARAGWDGEVLSLEASPSAPVVVDALFGIGMSRPFPEDLSGELNRLVNTARLSIAVDVPSGVHADETYFDGAPGVDVTLAIGALKPAHLDELTAGFCGTVRLIDIGLAVEGGTTVLAPPELPTPGVSSHKYTRGMVAVVSGEMPGAALLAAEAALRSGAGYVVLADGGAGGPDALVRRPFNQAVTDKRLGAILVGPGLGGGSKAREVLDSALASDVALVIDGDALALLGDHGLQDLPARHAPTILTPHEGEFERLFGSAPLSRIRQTEMAAAQSGAIVVRKGAFTIVARNRERAVVAPRGSAWLSTAGTGDVLAGTIAAQLAAGMSPLQAAAAGVWLHAEAARRLGGAFIADDLLRELSAARRCA